MSIVERLRLHAELGNDGTVLAAQAADEIDHLRTLAKDAYEAWDSDQEARVGKLLRAMLDDSFCRMYRPDLVPNAKAQ